MNFKEYIEKDIEEKKALLDLLPMNTEARVKKYKESVAEIIKNYEPTAQNTRKYIDYKYEKLYPKVIDKSEVINSYQQQINTYKKILPVTNHFTSFYERLGFDMLIFELEHYYNYSLEDNNKTITQIIDKIKMAGIPITSNDFKLNIFSYNYMDNLFKMINGTNINTEILKNIFWKCPNVYENIIISFRFLIESNEKRLEKYANDYELKLLKDNGFTKKEELINKLYEIEKQDDEVKEKDEAETIIAFMQDELDFGVYKDTLTNLYGELDYFLINPIDTNNPDILNKTVLKISEFHDNLVEYGNYSKNIVIFDYIKNLYNKTISSLDVKQLNKDVKNQKNTIKKLYNKAKKMYAHLVFDTVNIEQALTNKIISTYMEQQKILNDLYTEINKSDSQHFNYILKNKISTNAFVSDILNIIISYPFYSRSIIKSVYEYENNEDVDTKYNELFDLFYNKTRKLIDMKSIFSTENFERRLMDSYRFDNLNVNETTFEEDNQNLIFTNYSKLKNKMKISHFKHSLDEIEFLINIKKMKDEETSE